MNRENSLEEGVDKASTRDGYKFITREGKKK
jgi:hypothetical protein